MKKKNIRFSMIHDKNETRFESVGTYEQDQLSFIDHENQKNSILFKKNKVEYIKTGEKFMHYTFDENNITEGIYRIDQFEFGFQIHTTFIEYTDKLLKINFTLQQDDEIVGHHQLMIVYKDDEEDLNGL